MSLPDWIIDECLARKAAAGDPEGLAGINWGKAPFPYENWQAMNNSKTVYPAARRAVQRAIDAHDRERCEELRTPDTLSDGSVSC